MSSSYFNKLNYTIGDEDTSLEYNLLPENSSHVMSIAGSGGRVVPLLAKNPKLITCVDVSDLQLYLTELRIKAIEKLEYDEYLGFLGYEPYCFNSEKREKLFFSLKPSENVRLILGKYFHNQKWNPIIYMGRFEKMLIFFSKIINLITLGRMREFFICTDINQQKEYFYSKKFPTKSWKAAIKILGNAKSLNYILYNGAFPEKNIPGSYSEIYLKIFERVFLNILVKESFFLQLLLLGKIKFLEGNPIETKEDIFYKIKKNISHISIRYFKGDILNAIDKSNDFVNFLSLSDVPNFFNQDTEISFLQNIKNKLTYNAYVVFRDHLKISKPIMHDYMNITHTCEKFILEETTQLWIPSIFKYERGNFYDSNKNN